MDQKFRLRLVLVDGTVLLTTEYNGREAEEILDRMRLASSERFFHWPPGSELRLVNMDRVAVVQMVPVA